MSRVALIQGHPIENARHFCHALSDAYKEGARQGGHGVREIGITKLQFPLLRSRQEWETEQPASDIAASRETIAWAEHLVFV